MNFTKEFLKKYVNLKTEEDGFTAIHFASFKGFLELIEFLIELGADFNKTNNFGINVIHLAA